MIPAATRALRPSDVARRRRTARRAAHGFSRPALARAENLPEADVERLLAAPDFQGLVAAYRHLAALPEAEQVAHLARLARMVLHEALARGDLRAALFVLKEQERRRDPALTLARGVVAEGERAARPPAPGPRAAKPRVTRLREPAEPDDSARWRGATLLRAAVAAEHEAQHPDPAAAPPPAPVTAPTKAGPKVPPSPGLARLTAALAGSASPSALGLRLPAFPEPAGPALRGLPRRPRAP